MSAHYPYALTSGMRLLQSHTLLLVVFCFTMNPDHSSFMKMLFLHKSVGWYHNIYKRVWSPTACWWKSSSSYIRREMTTSICVSC